MLDKGPPQLLRNKVLLKLMTAKAKAKGGKSQGAAAKGGCCPLRLYRNPDPGCSRRAKAKTRQEQGESQGRMRARDAVAAFAANGNALHTVIRQVARRGKEGQEEPAVAERGREGER